MRGCIAAIVVLAALAAQSRALVVSSRYITSDVTWSPADDTIKITREIFIRNGATLVIEAGTNVTGFKADLSGIWRWCVYTQSDAAIQVNGTKDNNVNFYAVCLEWDGITRDEDNWVKNATFRSGWGHGLCEFRNDNTGSSEVSHVLFENITMPDCGSCGFYITSGGSPTIRRGVFNGGTCGIWGHGGGEMVIEYSMFTNHSATAIIPGGMGSQNNPASYEPMSCRINHCTFNNIDDKGSVSGVPAATGFAICTINYPGTLIVTNSIFQNIARSAIRDNNIEDYHYDENWVVSTDYNCYYMVGEDPVRLLPTGSHSIVDQDPLMNDPDNGDVSLKAGSPCLNVASDGTNIGAWQGPTSVREPDIYGSFTAGLGALANPFRGSVVFNFDSYNGAWLNLYNTRGEQVNRLLVQNNRVHWDGRDSQGIDLVPGLYYYNLNADNFSSLRTIIKID